ncbi:type I-E CRISPR-associated protein Cas5/CasD [Arcanobacterium hippocoleae]|uniref:CRISPR system Cascade subunit CasD n=1 Tax=Arcanobacterium hippocoleae TaxID=149017 RepID=A0ABU1T1T1_9ACTO|nr:type I-E CRISPR-associated protein Cas5/CasD [Arcanobacterium hippocoleae]MDR6939332.1 CRISPR system Cascade subunit CasD [Arcanobacterium hippocoleae]
MSVLILRLAAPLQAWGDSSRYSVRETQDAPTRSGILGLLCAAEGRDRKADISDLNDLQLAVRIDQPGKLLRDFQTERSLDGKVSMPLSARFYREDAVYTVFISAEAEKITHFDRVLRNPVYPLYLGRRSCPPAQPLIMGIVEMDLLRALQTYPWQAAEWYQRRIACRGEEYWAEALLDPSIEWADEAHSITELHRDIPVSYSREKREYTWRKVRRVQVKLYQPEDYAAHDPMELLVPNL